MVDINLNDVVLVNGIGYGVMINCANGKSVRIRKDQQPAVKKDESLTLANLFIEAATSASDSSSPSQVQPEPSKPASAPPIQPKSQPELTSLSEIVTVKLTPSQALVYTCVANLSVTTTVRVKTLFSSRAELKLDVSISAPLDAVKRMIFERLRLDINFFYNVRLIYPGYELRELSRPFCQEQVRPEAKMVMLAQSTFSLVAGQNATNLKLSRNNLTLTKAGDQNYSTGFGNVSLEKEGRYYWEFKLDNFCESDDIFVGVAKRTISAEACPTHAGEYWGYMPLCAKRFSSEETGNLLDYGFSQKIGETVGVLLHIKKGEGSLLFFRSGLCCGKAYDNIPVPVHAAVTLKGKSNNVVQVTMDPRAQLPMYDLN